MKKLTTILSMLFFVVLCKAQGWVDVTSLYLANPDYAGNSNAGWTISSNAFTQACNYGCQEFWNGTSDISQTLALPNGRYRVTVNAFYRPADFSRSSAQAPAGVKVNAVVYANNDQATLKSLYADPIASYTAGCFEVGGKYYPNNMESANAAFSQGLYSNTLEANVTTGSLRLGLRNTEHRQSNWLIMDNWRLEVYGVAAQVERIELAAASTALVVGEQQQVQATVLPEDALVKRLAWTSSNASVLTVDADGRVTARGQGVATITAKALDGSGKEASLEFTVAMNTAAQTSLIINEIHPANVDQLMDPSWNYGSWLELYNPTSSAITLTGMGLSHEQGQVEARIAEPMAIAAGGYQLLWFDHHDRYAPTQLDMKLDQDGATLYLTSASGAAISAVDYPAAIARCSYARKSPDGDEWGWSATPTPGSSNAQMTYHAKRLAAPVVDTPSQLYAAPLTVSVAIPDGAQLRYTTDGSTPTATHGAVSTTGRFTVAGKTTIYRFCLVSDEALPSQVVTRSYILKDKLFSLPVVSVVSDSLNLWGEDYGIFVQGNGNGRPGNGQSAPCNWNMDWDRPAHFEWLDAQGTVQVSQEVAMERCGGWSRAWAPYSFKLKANKLYEGQNYLPYNFFSAKPYLRHRTLQLRNGGNDTYCRIKDAALQEIVARSGIDIDGQAYQPAMHYINGKYAGVINVREPNNKHFALANYALDDDEIDQFEMSPDSGYVQKCGTYESMARWMALARECGQSQEAYEQIRQMVDIDEYINYMAVELWLCGTDWPQNNVKAFKPIADGGKFRFVLFDLDHAFGTSSPFTTFAGKQTYTFDELLGEPGGRQTKEIEMVTLFLNMLKNSSFRKQFIDTYCLVSGSVFEPSRCKSIITELANNVHSTQQLSSEVYGNGSSPWGTANTLISTLTSSRQTSMIRQLRNYQPMGLSSNTGQQVSLSADIDEARLLVNGLPVPTGSFSGTLFQPVRLTAEAPAGYAFAGWEAGGSIISTEQSTDLPVSSSALTVKARFRALTSEEKAQQGLTAKVVINEVSAANSINVNEYWKKDDWVELYNTTAEDIDLEGMYLTDDSQRPHRYMITAGATTASTVIPAHGYKIIWCSGRKTQSELHASFKLGNKVESMVRLEAADGSWADSLWYAPHAGDQSVGRYPDGGRQTYVMAHTSIAASNTMDSYTAQQPYSYDSGATAITSLLADRHGAMTMRYRAGTLLISNAARTPVTLSIYTPAGTLVATAQLTADDGQAIYRLTTLPAGSYIARATEQGGGMCSGKVVLIEN